MSETLSQQVRAALTDEVLSHADSAYFRAIGQGIEACYEEQRKVILAALEPLFRQRESASLQTELLDLITLMPDTQTQEIVDYIATLRAARSLREPQGDGTGVA